MLDNAENANKFVCVGCDFKCCKQSNYNTHLLTHKHQKIMGNNQTECQPSSTISIICPDCNKKYSHLSGLCRHRKTCVSVKQNMSEPVFNNLLETKSSDEFSPDENIKISSTDLQNIITETQFCKKMMVELIKTNNNLQEQILEMMKKSQTHTPETAIAPTPATAPSSIGVATNGDHNTNTINSNNNTFNMNMFLNEQCKDAMNMKDFVNSIQLNLTDLENVERDGYVKGMSNILINNLQKTDVYKRPVHCSDVKRDTLYVKENNEWARDGPDHPKMVNAVLAVEHKNVALVSEWAKANPRCMNSNTRENERYMKLSKAATDGEKEGNIAKVIKRVAKNVAIDKEPAH